MEIYREALEEVFSSLIRTVREKQHVGLSEYSEDYIVGVLCGFISNSYVLPMSLYPGELFRQAITKEGVVRRESLRLCGDLSLFISGIFPDSLDTHKRAIKLGDYIDVGIEAYGLMGGVIFSELSQSFPKLIDVLNEVSVTLYLTSNDLDKYLYRRRQIDERLARR